MCRHIIISVVSLMSLQALAAEHPSVSELLDKYAETQDKVQSFIAKTVSLAETISSNPEYKGKKRYYRTLSEIRSDGEQEYALMYMWNNISSPGEVKSKDKASYISNLWDGKSFLSYARDERNDLGSVIINRSSKYRTSDKILPNSGDGTAMGYCFGDGIRVDSILRKADAISVRDKTEHISGSECYVIDAETKRGKYKLWIDPKHGYNLVKAEVRRREGDLSQGRPIPKGTLSSFLENVRFEKVDGVWVPMEWDIKVTAYWLDEHLISKTHNKRTTITLNPDHEALGSFIPDDIKNGAKVYIQQVPGINYIWQDGELVPDVDKAVIDVLDKRAKEIMAEAKVPPALAAGKKDSVPASLSALELLDKYAATQDKLQSFIAKGQSTIEKNNRKEETTSEFRFDGNRVNHRSTFWDEMLTTKERPGYKSFLWDGKSFVEFNKAREPKNSRVFVKQNDLSKNEKIATEYKGATLLGFLAGDSKRIDSILSKADNISLAGKPEKLNNVDCLVIEAAVNQNQYKIWFDPQHDYHIVRAEVQKVEFGKKLSFSLDNVRFEKIDNVWVPMEADVDLTKDNGNKITKWHHKRTEMILDPDHDVLGSFLANDIPDGIKVIFPGRFDKTVYVWQNSKPVAEVDSDVKP